VEHEHHFNQHLPKSGEVRTRWVVCMTAGMMVVEITAGILFGSMALLADGLHMASHTAALGLSVFAYVFARRRAHDRSFSFGTGKFNALAGFASAIVLALFALLMIVESVDRFMNPVSIAYNEAIFVAILGLAVNGISVLILHDRHLVARWSWGLLRGTSRVLVDRQASDSMLEQVRLAIAGDSVRILDLHVWEIGPGYRAAIVSVESEHPITPHEVKEMIPEEFGIAHTTVEIHVRGDGLQSVTPEGE